MNAYRQDKNFYWKTFNFRYLPCGAALMVVFVLSSAAIADTLVHEACLRASKQESKAGFGMPMAMDGDTLLIGAPNEDSSATEVNGDQDDNSARDAGAAYVFVRNERGEWNQQAYLKASNAGENDVFGGSVAIYGDTVVVGAASEDGSATGVNGDQHDNSAVNA